MSAHSAGWRFSDALLTEPHPFETGMLVNRNRATQSDIDCVARWQLVVGGTSWYGSVCVLAEKGSSWFSCWLFHSLDAAEKLHLPHRNLGFRKSASS